MTHSGAQCIFDIEKLSCTCSLWRETEVSGKQTGAEGYAGKELAANILCSFCVNAYEKSYEVGIYVLELLDINIADLADSTKPSMTREKLDT